MRETTMQSGRLVRGSDRVVDKRAWISAREDVESGVDVDVRRAWCGWHHRRVLCVYAYHRRVRSGAIRCVLKMSTRD